MEKSITLKITDREGITHKVQAPTDMNMSIMELVRAYELVPNGTIGLCGGKGMCPSCQCHVLNDVELPEKTPNEIMVSSVFNASENRRMSCQIKITPEIEGLEIELVSMS